MTDARICYVFASRSRPQKFFDALDNIQDMSESKNYFVWGKLDDDDLFADMYQKRLEEYPELTVKWGLSQGKVSAINRSMEDLPPCDIIIMQSDDIVWDVYGFDTEIRNAFKRYFPDYSGTVHFPDDHGQERTIIVSMLGANLYKGLGYLYWGEYESVFADDDFTNMVKVMGCYTFINKRLFSHNHPIWLKTEWDSQYRHSERPEVYQKDREVFEKRKANNFGL